jgi:serine protease Do
VFIGLRLINVSFGSNSDLADGTELPVEGETPESVPAGTTQTTVGSISSGATNWDDIARSVVYFEVGGSCQWVGSGTLILDGSYVLTNWHVSGGGECPMQVGFTDNVSKPPTDFFTATVVCWDSQIDLAIVQLKDASGAPYIPPGRKPVTIASSEIRLGETVRILGYPVIREDQFEAGERYTLTLTDGVISGTENFGERSGYKPSDSRTNDYEVWGDYFKHTAKQNGGVSGGGAFNSAGQLVGIPTAGSDNLELMRPVRFAKVLIGQTD